MVGTNSQGSRWQVQRDERLGADWVAVDGLIRPIGCKFQLIGWLIRHGSLFRMM